MLRIDLKKIPWSFNEVTNSIIVSERDVKFTTEYLVISPRTGNGKTFSFSHSTGPEFDVSTRWVYKSDIGTILEVCNDTKMVAEASKNYLNAKLRN